ncbi:hypothetical protein Tco_0084581 [Tanacetum coccineum]
MVRNKIEIDGSWTKSKLWNVVGVVFLAVTQEKERERLLNFRRNPFRIFNKWIGFLHFYDVVLKSWASSIGSYTPDIQLKNNLRKLRYEIKHWTSRKLADQQCLKDEMFKNLEEWDMKAEVATLNQTKVGKQEEWIMEDVKQKCRLRQVQGSVLVHSIIERGFLSQKGSGVGRGVKEKSLNRNSMNTFSGIGVFMKSDDTMNEDTIVGVASAVQEGVTPSVVDMMVEKEKICSLEETTVLESFPTLTTLVTSTAGNAPGKSSYANITGKPSGKKVNVRTLFTSGGNGIDVVLSVDSIHAISERFANTAYGFLLGKKVAYTVVANYVRNTWGKYGLVRSMFSSSTRLFSFQFSSMDRLDAMLENGPWFTRNNPLILKKWHLDENLLKEDVSTIPVWVKLYGVPVTAFSEDGLSAIATKLELKDNIVVAMPKITREGHYICNVRVEYEWKPPRCSFCKVFGHIQEECLKNTGTCEKKPSQTSRGVLVGPKMGFKPQKEYQPVPKKPNASSSGNKKKGVEPTIEVSNSNPFDVLKSVDNDEEFGTNGGTINLVNNGATSSGSSFMNADNDREFASNTPIVPTGIMESHSEVEVVFDETANLRISTSGKDGSDKGYDTMRQIGVGIKWRKWIDACLSSASILVLINGLPLKEFKMERGLRQRDPLSPLLFLLVAEALQVAIMEAYTKGLFKGISLAGEGANISLLQYADDVLLLVVGVLTFDVEQVAASLGCTSNQLPFKYLGLPVGKSMRTCGGWNDVVDRFNGRLSAWNAKNLSIEGGLRLLNRSLASLLLGIQKLTTGNALGKMGIDKNPDTETLTAVQFLWGCSRAYPVGNRRVWYGITKTVSSIEELIPAFKNSFQLKVFNGSNTLFWKDPCCGSDVRLKDSFLSWRLVPRGRATSDLDALLSIIGSFALEYSRDDTWSWRGDAYRIFKVNICVWRASLNRLLSRVNLSSRGVPLSSSLFPFYDNEIEDIEHSLIKCSKVLPV